MRGAAVAFGLFMLAAATAYAEPVTYQCSRLGEEALVLQDNSVLPGEYQGEPETALVIDWQANRMRFGTGTEMPIIANEQGMIGLLRTVTPAQGHNPAQQVFITYRLIRATGRLSTDAHIVMSDTMMSIKMMHQCRTASGATAF